MLIAKPKTKEEKKMLPKRAQWLLATLVILTMILAACGPTEAPPVEKPTEKPVEKATEAKPPAEEEPFRVAVIMPSAINDLAFSQSMYAALLKMQEKLGGPDKMELVYSDNMFVVDDAAAAIRDYAAQGYNLIIAHGSQYGSSLREIAPDFPETAFAHGTTVDTFVDEGINNVFAYEAAADQGGYVNGVMAGKLTKSNVIGIVGPIETGDAKLYIDGFVAGAKASNPDAQVNVNYIGSFSDVALASEAANTHVAAGADILAGTAQMVVGAIGVAEEKGALWFGTQASQTTLAPEIVVANQVYDWSVSLEDMFNQISQGTMGGTAYNITLANKGLVMEYNPDFDLPADVKDAAEETAQDIVDGTIVVGGPPAEPPTGEEFLFGVIMVGPYNDHGWSEAHYTAGEYIEQNLPGAKMIWLDKLNTADRPETTLEQVVDDMVAQGVQLVFTTSDDFQVDTDGAAAKYPDIPFVMISGDHALTGDAPPNIANYMGKMEYGKMIAGCAAALKTETGVFGYLGPLINDETRRLANSVYLGARYCYENYRGADPDSLEFIVQWIGFWFNIPGVTLDPTEVANDIFNAGADVILSGIDTTEAIVVAGQRAGQGETAWAIPYDYEGACDEAPDICLGVPYFNWGPSYLDYAKKVQAGTFEQEWIWAGPDWTDINRRDTTAVGYLAGEGLTAEEAAQLDEFIAGLADGSIALFVGPLNYQDGSVYLADGEAATDEQIWYTKQLLEGMTGPSE
jgi:simple sugar transport system substrate-binding protein